MEEEIKSKGRMIKGALPDLTQFLETENPLKMMKNAFYFTSSALLVFIFMVM